MFDDYDDLIRQMQDELERYANQTYGTWVRQQEASAFWQPRVDVGEYRDRLVVKFEVGRLNPQRLRVSLSADNRVLTVRGVREEDPAEFEGRLRCHQLEIYYGPFSRSVPLPGNLTIDREQVTSQYRNGFLEVVLPTRVPVAPRKVEII